MQIVPFIDCRLFENSNQSKLSNEYLVDVIEQQKKLFENFKTSGAFRLIHNQESKCNDQVHYLKGTNDLLVPVSRHELSYEAVQNHCSELGELTDHTFLVSTSLRYPYVNGENIQAAISQCRKESCDCIVSVDNPHIPIGRYWKRHKQEILPYIPGISPFDRRQDQPKSVIVIDAVCVVRPGMKGCSKTEAKVLPIWLPEASRCCVGNINQLYAVNHLK